MPRAATGWILGFDEVGNIIETLPGTFVTIGDGEFASVTGGPGITDPFAVTITGITTGAFTLEVTRTADGKRSTMVYPAVPVDKGTVATVTVDAGAATSATMSVVTGAKTTFVEAEGGEGPDDGWSTRVVLGVAIVALAAVILAGVLIARHRTRRPSL